MRKKKKKSDICLFSVSGKIISRVLLNRLHENPEQMELLPERWGGFREVRGTNDIIFNSKRMHEELNIYLSLCWPHQCIWHSDLWWAIEIHGLYVWLSSQVHRNVSACSIRVLHDWCSVINSVKQGWVLGPTLLSMIFSAKYEWFVKTVTMSNNSGTARKVASQI